MEELRGGMVVSGPQVQIAECMRLFAGGVIMAALGETGCQAGGGWRLLAAMVVRDMCDGLLRPGRRRTAAATENTARAPIFTVLLLAVGLLLLLSSRLLLSNSCLLITLSFIS